MPMSCDKQNSKTVSGVSRGPTPWLAACLVYWHGQLSPELQEFLPVLQAIFLLYQTMFDVIKLVLGLYGSLDMV